MERHTKIIATMGPAVASAEAVQELVAAGMDVARLNFSHGTYDDHRRFAEWVRAAGRALDKPVGLLQDTQGPEIRTGLFPGGEIVLRAQEEVRVLPGKGEAAPGQMLIDYEHLVEDVAVGEEIVLADGLMRLRVIDKDSDGLVASTMQAGKLADRRGVAFPSTELRISAITDQDRADLEFGRTLGVDYVAASFVRSGSEIEEVAALAGGSTPVIAKIEMAAACENLDDILRVAEGAMVARGDLGVQLPLQRIPLVQHDIIRRTNNAGRISITATEMLDSMTNSIRPTRAEVTDVSDAVLSGTDVVMLSGETAVGKYPAEAVAAMDAICRETESWPEGAGGIDLVTDQPTFASATAKGAVDAASELGIETIVAFTESGDTALLLSKYRPAARIVAFTPEEATLYRMALYRGVSPERFGRVNYTDLMIYGVEKELMERGVCKKGEVVAIVAGIPPNRGAFTNLMKLHVIGESTEGVPSQTAKT